MPAPTGIGSFVFVDFDAARPESDDRALIYSLSEVRELLFAAFDAVGATTVAEVGAEAGGFTERLVRWAAERDGTMYSIEPFPTPLVRQLAEASPAMTLVEGLSQDVIPTMDPSDIYLLDGDHNYYTVEKELQAIAAVAEENSHYPLVIMQDIAWPWGRRDLYYEPKFIPSEYLQPYDWGGVLPWETSTVRGGFRGEGHYAAATEEGGHRNGVLTALEDFLDVTPGWTADAVPCDFGLALLRRSDSPWEDRLQQAVGWSIDNPLLARLERNRVGLYLKVVDLQDQLERQRRNSANALSSLQSEIDDLRSRLEIADQVRVESAEAGAPGTS